jgi:hypothetical protein
MDAPQVQGLILSVVVTTAASVENKLVSKAVPTTGDTAPTNHFLTKSNTWKKLNKDVK